MYIKNVKLLLILALLGINNPLGLRAAGDDNSNYELFLPPQVQKGRGSLVEVLSDSKVVLGVAGTLTLLVGAGIYYNQQAKTTTGKDHQSNGITSDVSSNKKELLAQTDVSAFAKNFKEVQFDNTQREALRILFKEYDVFKGDEGVVKKCLANLSSEGNEVLSYLLSCLPGFAEINAQKDFSGRTSQLASFFKVHGGMINKLINESPVDSNGVQPLSGDLPLQQTNRSDLAKGATGSKNTQTSGSGDNSNAQSLQEDVPLQQTTNSGSAPVGQPVASKDGGSTTSTGQQDDGVGDVEDESEDESEEEEAEGSADTSGGSGNNSRVQSLPESVPLQQTTNPGFASVGKPVVSEDVKTTTPAEKQEKADEEEADEEADEEEADEEENEESFEI